MLRPLFALMIKSHICLRVYGSHPAVGSSRNTTSGSPSNAMAIHTLLCIPPENDFTGLSASSSLNLSSSKRRSTWSCIPLSLP
mmetsp:Transcript_23084/g.68093  ORF Transcript_23084/g.68093 Transcript_23084/m.68093 type:complete len:83 (+) Transcript_23084:3454-3702(+)